VAEEIAGDLAGFAPFGVHRRMVPPKSEVIVAPVVVLARDAVRDPKERRGEGGVLGHQQGQGRAQAMPESMGPESLPLAVAPGAPPVDALVEADFAQRVAVLVDPESRAFLA
jgi:hypothetical protein